MKTITPEQAINTLKSGHFDQFKGAIEDDSLEYKAEPYRLDDEHQKHELAKDVSALANAKGGVIIIGVQTERDVTHSTDIIVKIRSFPSTLIKVSQYEDVVRAWVYPPIKQLEIKWFQSSADASLGLVGIIVPEQDALWRPFLLTRSIEQSGRISTTLFGYAERGNGKSVPMSVQQLHTILRDGYRVGTGALIPISPTKSETSRDLREQLDAKIEKAIEAVSLGDRPVFILAATPTESTDVELLFSGRDTEPVKLLEAPPELRPHGFGPGAGMNSRIIEGKCRRTVIPEYKLLEAWRDGSIIMIAAGDAEFLAWGNRSDNSLRINQLVLIECAYLFAKLTHAFLHYASPEPRSFNYVLSIQRMSLKDHCILFPGPLTEFPHGENRASGSDFTVSLRGNIADDPGITSYQLISRVYHWFGFEDDRIPYSGLTSNKERMIDPNQIISMNTRVL